MKYTTEELQQQFDCLVDAAVSDDGALSFELQMVDKNNEIIPVNVDVLNAFIDVLFKRRHAHYGTRDTLAVVFSALFPTVPFPSHHEPEQDFWRHTHVEVLVLNGEASATVHLHQQSGFSGEYYGEPHCTVFYEDRLTKSGRVKAMSAILGHFNGGHVGMGMKDYHFRVFEPTRDVTLTMLDTPEKITTAKLLFGQVPKLPALTKPIKYEPDPAETVDVHPVHVERYDVIVPPKTWGTEGEQQREVPKSTAVRRHKVGQYKP